METSVPQGSCLSSDLFDIYINDLLDLNVYPNEKITSLLFADDLFSFNIDKLTKRLMIQMNRYLKQLEIWLNTWRATMATNKCSVTIYSKQIPKELKNGEFKLFLYGQSIPINHEPKYLGVIIDRNLNFNLNTNIIRDKCLKHLNILKCLSYKNWSLSVNEKLTVYKSLIRSCMEYAPIIQITSDYNLQRLCGIQHQALKIIYKQSGPTSTTWLNNISQTQPFDERIYELSSKYLERQIIHKNPLIIELIDQIIFSAHQRSTPLEKIGLNT